MDTEKLAPVFLDNKPVNLKEPKPKVSAVLSASGKPETTDVKWLKFQTDKSGKSLRSEEIVDRTADPAKPIYLTSSMDEQESSEEGSSDRSEKGAGREEFGEGREGKGGHGKQAGGRQQEEREGSQQQGHGDREDRQDQGEHGKQAGGRQQEEREGQANRPKQAGGRQQDREGGSSRIEPQRRKENR